jgi:hypothetical protein
MQTIMRTLRPAAAVVAITMAVGSPAYAQTAKTDLSAGYQLAELSQNGFADVFPYGFYVDLSRIVRPTWAVIGEFGGVYRSADGVTVHEYTYQGGVRYFSRMNPRWTPFGQALVGRATAGGGGLDSVSAFTVQLGGGVNGRVTRRLSVRIAVDYRRVFFSETQGGGGENDLRLGLGLVVPLAR